MSGLVAVSNQNVFIDTARGVYDGARQVIKNVKQIQGDPATFGRAIRIVSYLFAAIAPGTQQALHAKLSITDNLTDTLQVFNSAHEIVNGKKEEQSLAVKLANIAMLSSGTGASVMLMDDLSILSLPTVASETGGWNIFAHVTKSTLGKISSVGAGIGYTLLSLDWANKLSKANEEIKNASTEKERQIGTLKRSKAMINMIWSISEVALKVLVIAAIASTASLLVVGLVAAGLGIACFLYNEHVKVETSRILELKV